MLKTITLDQSRDTDLTYLDLPFCQMRYAFARSWESRTAGDNSQDSLCISIDRDTFSFSLCDGVSMSFMGDIAARYLGQKLAVGLPGLVNFKEKGRDFEKNLTRYLKDLVPHATSLMASFRLPAGLLPMVASVLEEKRKAGGESMFVCGLLDFRADRLALAWMGDSRLRVWLAGGEATEHLLGNTFQTTERWSTRTGPVGQVHTYQGGLSSILKIMAYSDGIAAVDGPRNTLIPDQGLREVIRRVGETPNSDDISFLEVILKRIPG